MFHKNSMIFQIYQTSYFYRFLIKQLQLSPIHTTNLPPSISFFSADAKFDGEHLKFCELGNGLYGVICPVYGLLKEQKAILYPPYWEFLWLYASQFNIPVWCIRYNNAHIAEKTLQKLGGKIFRNIEEFEKYLETNYPTRKINIRKNLNQLNIYRHSCLCRGQESKMIN